MSDWKRTCFIRRLKSVRRHSVSYRTASGGSEQGCGAGSSCLAFPFTITPLSNRLFCSNCSCDKGPNSWCGLSLSITLLPWGSRVKPKVNMYIINLENRSYSETQQIVTLSKYGHIVLDICYPYVTYICKSRHWKRKTAKNVDGTIQIF